jgi:hypothetical protein
MSDPRKDIWIVEIAGRRKEHIVRSDEFGRPRDRTLCGIPCPAADRKHAKQTATPSGRECSVCRKRLAWKREWKIPMGQKRHWLRKRSDLRSGFDVEAACGQRYATEAVSEIEGVDCARCLELAAKVGVRKKFPEISDRLRKRRK